MATLHIQRILLPVDFSPPSQEALRYAEEFRKQYGAELILLHVVEDVQYLTNTYLFEMPTLPPLEDVEREREKEFEQFIETHLSDRTGVRSVLVSGKPFVEILRLAQEEEVDLIIIASHGHTGLEHALFGSTAEKVMRKSHVPVLVVKPKPAPAP